jgi:hypothetical protein
MIGKRRRIINMASKKTNTYIDFELDWLTEKATQLKAYVDKNPFDELEDRIRLKETARGGAIPILAASIEAQIKSLTQALKDYALIIEVIDKLREKESLKKTSARGNTDLSPLEERAL